MECEREHKVWAYSESGQDVGSGSDAHTDDTLQPGVHKVSGGLLEQRVRNFPKYNRETSGWKLKLNLPKMLQYQRERLRQLVHGRILVSGKI